MKKNILFVIPSLTTGGAEKSLYGLLKYWDYEKYNVDVYTFAEKGIYADRLDERVNVISDNSLYRYVFFKGMFSSFKSLLKRGRIGLAFFRIIWGLEPVLYKLAGKKCHRNSRFDWFVQKKAMLRLDKHYDIAVGYMEGGPNYYVSDVVSADIKIGWIHTDYSKTYPNVHLDTTRFLKMKNVVTVSENSKREILKLMPHLSEKLVVIPNVIDTEKIDRMTSEIVMKKESEYAICSVGRLVKLKGFDIAVDTAKLLSDEGIDFKWYIVGSGEEEDNLRSQIKSLGLEDKVVLTGSTENPYSYMNMADACVQLSEYEGRGLVVEEAQYLLTPVIASNIGAFKEIVDNGITGIIAERNPENVAKSVKEVLFDKDLATQIKNNLENNRFDDKKIAETVEKLWLLR